MDAVQKAPLKPAQRHELIKTIAPAIKNAVSRAKENSQHWTHPHPAYSTLT